MLRDKLTELSEAANRAFLDNDLKNALELYDQAIQLCPANHVLHSNRSATLLRLERFRESLDEAEQSILINPKWPKVFNFVRLRQTRYGPAVSAFRSQYLVSSTKLEGLAVFS